MSFPRYPEYCSTRLQWLPEVPSGWQLKKVAWDLDTTTGWTPTTGRADYYDGDNSWVTIADMSSECISETKNKISDSAIADRGAVPAPAGSVLFSFKLTVGKVAVLETPAYTNEAIAAFHPVSGINQRFWYYASPEILKTSCRPNIYGADMLNRELIQATRFYCPSVEEQTQIATFLDRETAKIDALVAEQERLIELLQEKQQAVISHAVTKGLNPDAPMKGSGVEWLGKVPAHWVVTKIKNRISTCSGGTPNSSRQELYYSPERAEYPWIRTTDLSDDIVTSVPINITQEALRDTTCKILPVGSVLIALYGGAGTIGKNGIMSFPASINQALCALLPSEHFCSEYLFRFIQHMRPYWMIGAESGRKDPNISQEFVRNSIVLCPPYVEQASIAGHLKAKLNSFEDLIKETKDLVNILGERRSALISAAVTGQIDVRNKMEA